MTRTHVWRVDSIEEFIANVQVDGRMMHVPKWMLPRGARAGDTLAVSHEVTAERSFLDIARKEPKKT